MKRRTFLTTATLGLSAAVLGCRPSEKDGLPAPAHPDLDGDQVPQEPPITYRGPNVILIRFGGGVRRHETIDRSSLSWCPFLLHELTKQGVLYSGLEIASAPGIVTSHVEGTLHLLTGRYDSYPSPQDSRPGGILEPNAPTLFDYFRRRYQVAEHEAVVINGADYSSDRYQAMTNHYHAGIVHRAPILSLPRFTIRELRKELLDDSLTDRERAVKQRQIAKLHHYNPCPTDGKARNEKLESFWENWTATQGEPGAQLPRGDRLLTTLALHALQQLRPKLLMINYQDTDEVHWGNRDSYTDAIRAMDEGVRELVAAARADEHYRQRTVFVVVPDCGRDNNRMTAIPFQHHFDTKTAHEIFAIVAGPKEWVPQGKKPQNQRRHQIDVTRTIGAIMGFSTPLAAGESLLG